MAKLFSWCECFFPFLLFFMQCLIYCIYYLKEKILVKAFFTPFFQFGICFESQPSGVKVCLFLALRHILQNHDMCLDFFPFFSSRFCGQDIGKRLVHNLLLNRQTYDFIVSRLWVFRPHPMCNATIHALQYTDANRIS